MAAKLRVSSPDEGEGAKRRLLGGEASAERAAGGSAASAFGWVLQQVWLRGVWIICGLVGDGQFGRIQPPALFGERGECSI